MNNSVRNLQGALRKISAYNPVIPRIIPDGKFGNQTESAVREFQKEYGIKETGIADYETHKKIYQVYSDILEREEPPIKVQAADENSLPLMKGSLSSSVIFLQAMLNAIGVKNGGFPSIEINGVFGEETENAVKEIQRLWGIPVTGVVNKETWNRITMTAMTAEP